MRIVKKRLVSVAVIFLMSGVFYAAAAQDPSSIIDDNCDTCGDPVNAPIDGGVTLLVAAAIAYGAKKAHASRKNDAHHIN